MSRKSILRALDEITPMPREKDKLFGKMKDLGKLSNLFGFTLSLQQVVAIVSMFDVAIVYFITKLLLINGNGSVNFIEGFSALYDYKTVCSNLLTIFYYVSYMFIPFILQVFILRQNPFKIVPVRKIGNARLLPIGIVTVLALSAVSEYLTDYIQLFLGFLHLQPVDLPFTIPDNPSAFFLYALELCAIAPICEEFIFRGVILQNLRQFGDGFAVLISALLFSMIHGNTLQMPLAFIIGLAFGFLVIETGSIWTTIIAHCLVNSTSVLFEAFGKVWNPNVVNAVYLVFSILFIAVFVFLVLRLRKSSFWRALFTKYTKSDIPMSFLVKRYFLFPGTVVQTVIMVISVILSLKVR